MVAIFAWPPKAKRKTLCNGGWGLLVLILMVVWVFVCLVCVRALLRANKHLYNSSTNILGVESVLQECGFRVPGGFEDWQP